MTKEVYYIIVAAILLVLIPIAPKIIAFRIKALRFLRLKRLANWHERNVRIITMVIRIILAALALFLLILALQM